MTEWEKTDFTLVVKLARYGNGLFVRIPKSITDAFELRQGDNLRIEVKEIKRYSVEDKPSEQEQK